VLCKTTTAPEKWSFRDASRRYPQESRNAYKKGCKNYG